MSQLQKDSTSSVELGDNGDDKPTNLAVQVAHSCIGRSCVVIVTGGGGFLGQRLVAQLIQDGTLGYDDNNDIDHKQDTTLYQTNDDNETSKVNDKNTNTNKNMVRSVPIVAIILADVYFPPPPATTEASFTANTTPATNHNNSHIKIIQMVGDISDKDYCQSLYDAAATATATATVHQEYDDDDPTNQEQTASAATRFPFQRHSYLSVYHLGAIMSGDGEKDFKRCMDVNLYGCINLLECTRQYHTNTMLLQHSATTTTISIIQTKFIFASAGAIIGCGAPTDYVSIHDVVNDAKRSTPHTTYGMTKACCELICTDYHRKQYIHCIVGIRLPTVIVRAGIPNSATTSCFSSIIREPLSGVSVSVPIVSTIKHAVTSTRLAISSMMHVHNIHTSILDNVLGYDRTMFIPAVPVSLQQLEYGLYNYIQKNTTSTSSTTDPKLVLGTIKYDIDPVISDIVQSFPIQVDAYRAIQIGIPQPSKSIHKFIETIIQEYIMDYPYAISTTLQKQLVSSVLVQTEEKEVLVQPPVAQQQQQQSKVHFLQYPEVHQSFVLPVSYENHKVAVITGGGSGIGRAVALRLLAQNEYYKNNTATTASITNHTKNSNSNSNSNSSNQWIVVIAGRRLNALQETWDLAKQQQREQVQEDKDKDKDEETSALELLSKTRDSTNKDDDIVDTNDPLRWCCCCIQADVTVEEDILRLFGTVSERYHRIDVLFNNAGTSHSSGTPLEHLEVHDMEAALRTNVIGPFVCSREAIRLFLRTTTGSNATTTNNDEEQEEEEGDRKGNDAGTTTTTMMQSQQSSTNKKTLRIINNGSLSAQVPRPYSIAYTTSKHAISGLTKSIALDGRNHNISCSQIDFGNVKTSISTNTNNVNTGGALQPNGTHVMEPYMSLQDAADAVAFMCNVQSDSNVLQMTIMATNMPYIGRG